MSAIRFPLLFSALLLGGCASVPHGNPQDPLEPFNRRVFQLNDALDKAVVKPVAKGYNAVMPAPGKMMVNNFFSNLNDVIVTVNDLLQLKLRQAVADGGRIAVNTTVGLFGLVDVATQVGLEKHDEDFGQTLGRWGVGSGPYLVLPLLGPSTVRDGIGDYVDGYAVWYQIDDVEVRNQLYAGDLLNRRARLLDTEGLLEEAEIDRYSFIRDAYLQRRLNRVYDGHPPRLRYDDEDDDTDAPASSGVSQGGGAAAPVQPEPAAASVAATSAVTAAPEEGPAGDESPRVYRMWVAPAH